MKDNPILVLGRPHSGTTMVMELLEILGVDINKEDNTTPNLIDKIGYGPHKEIRKIIVTGIKLIDIETDTEAIKMVKDIVFSFFPNPKGLWGFKALTSNKRLAPWFEAFPKAKIVHIYRNIESKHWTTPTWKDQQNEYKERMYRQLEKYPDIKVLELDYEYITKSSENVIIDCQRLADFLGVTFTEELKNKVKSLVRII